MRPVRSVRYLFAVAMAIAAAGCSGNADSPVAPSTTITPVPSAPSPDTTFTLRGRVRMTAPTETTGIGGATVRIGEGVNAGRTAVTNMMGYYQFTDLRPSSFIIDISADEYLTKSERVSLDRDLAADFHLTSVPRQMTHTSTGSIAAGDGTCHDGSGPRPCRIFVVPVHNTGHTDATLTWTHNDGVDLDLTLFQTGIATPLARSAIRGGGPEQVTASLPGGATYEFRVTWAAGAGSANYTLRVNYPY